MIPLEIILERKVKHYGYTQAAIEFAMSEYAEKFVLEFLKYQKEKKNITAVKSDVQLLNEFKIEYNV